ncbi:MAG: PEGA domain-containing protein [Candidatus Riflebacteria bacterium]|nr:PEGA domain-containing protein [Candidatus Riflebacteria bacterium]
MTRALAIAPLLAALATTSAHAGAHITVRSDLPATVVVDGRAVGKTPLRVKMLYAGDRKIEVHNRATGLSYTYKVRSPEGRTASRIIDTSFQGAPPLTRPIIEQVTLAAPPEPLAKPTHENRRTREKVRIRNTVLGASLVNALFNHGPHRNGIFVGLFWLGLLNELLHAK